MNISVVVCARNEEKYIGNCLKNLRKQIIKPEIVVVDGWSKDKTVKIAKKYADKVIFDNKKGIGDARNIGCKSASGEIVAYCDADSLPPINWTKKILENMGDNIAISGPITSYEGSKSIKRNLKIWTDYFFNLANRLKYPCFCGSNMAFKRNILLKHKFRVNVLEDFEIGNRLRKFGKIGYFKNMVMPISSRRYEKSFYRMAFKFYVLNFLRLKLNKKTLTESYWR